MRPLGTANGPRGLRPDAIPHEGLDRDAVTVPQQDASFRAAMRRVLTPVKPAGHSLRARLELQALLAEHKHPAVRR